MPSAGAGVGTGQTGLVATPDGDDDSTKFGDNVDQAFVEWVSGAEDCPASDDVGDPPPTAGRGRGA